MKRLPAISFVVATALLFSLATTTAIAQPDFWQRSLTSDVYGLTFTPSGAVLASPGDFIFKSTDEGLTWGQTTPVDSFFFFSLASAPNGAMYGGGPGVRRSTDFGETWNTLPNSSTFYADVVAVRPNGHLFTGGTSGIFRSTDDGQTWTRLRLGASLRWTEVPALMVTPSGDLLASSYNSVNRVFLSKNEGHSWHAVGVPVSHNWWWVFGVAANGDLLASGGVRTSVGTVPTLYRSTNGGSRWRKVHGFVGVVGITSIATTASGDIYVGSSSAGVYHSTDNGVTFTQVNTGLPTLHVRSLAISPGGYLYAIAAGDGIYRSQLPVGPQPSFSPTHAALESEKPSAFRLAQNYPNPFNPTTTVEFELANDALVTVKVYNMLGQDVATLAKQEEYPEGTTILEFDGSGLSSGVYYLRIVAQDIATQRVAFTSVMKMVLAR